MDTLTIIFLILASIVGFIAAVFMIYTRRAETAFSSYKFVLPMTTIAMLGLGFLYLAFYTMILYNN